VRLPFNLDAKSLLVGIVIAYFVLPWILGKFASAKAKSTPAQ
jgi:hypothetical protein